MDRRSAWQTPPTPEPPRPESLWLATTDPTDYDSLSDDLAVDIAVVGGGIAGLTAAIELVDAGRTVSVLETDRIVEGVTGHTTAKLTAQHGLRYDFLLDRFDEQTARTYAEANEEAIDAIERRAATLGVDCDFQRTPAYTYADSRSDVAAVRDEARAAQQVGLPASLVEETPLPFPVEAAVRFDEQALFRPRKYLPAVADAVHGDGSTVIERTTVLEIDGGQPSRSTISLPSR